MAPSPDISILLDEEKQSQLAAALALIKSHYGDLRGNWAHLTKEQKIEVLRSSPVLKKFVAFFQKFEV